MKDLKEKVAFITGGASGIGLGIAGAFLSPGSAWVMPSGRPSRLVWEWCSRA
jgi:NAD(P)-dependent dehydrogenase (short-subunit alcohol dehydrogenase family)